MKKIVVLDGKTLGNVDYIKLNEFGQVVYYDMTYKNQISERIEDADIVLTNKVELKECDLKNGECRYGKRCYEEEENEKRSRY